MKTILHGVLSDVRYEGQQAMAILKTENGQDTVLYLRPIGLKIIQGYAERSFTVRVKGWKSHESIDDGIYVTNLTGYLKASA
ncbi:MULTISPECIES: hypothetical protein [Flammeovirga]|uniref:Uncharacterized protein n=1 Tax=Flammeovirga agarivorans TaxID=2726742 RepID=A0A7X8SGM8_9BACT|nr:MULTISPECIES: hypothetical protein [Flammeovirga]NLR89891.1 hypothetical protein [Flammeovirga agarivorans]